MSDEPQMFTDISHTIGMVETWVELIRVIKDQIENILNELIPNKMNEISKKKLEDFMLHFSNNTKFQIKRLSQDLERIERFKMNYYKYLPTMKNANPDFYEDENNAFQQNRHNEHSMHSNAYNDYDYDNRDRQRNSQEPTRQSVLHTSNDSNQMDEIIVPPIPILNGPNVAEFVTSTMISDEYTKSNNNKIESSKIDSSTIEIPLNASEIVLKPLFACSTLNQIIEPADNKSILTEDKDFTSLAKETQSNTDLLSTVPLQVETSIVKKTRTPLQSPKLSSPKPLLSPKTQTNDFEKLKQKPLTQKAESKLINNIKKNSLSNTSNSVGSCNLNSKTSTTKSYINQIIDEPPSGAKTIKYTQLAIGYKYTCTVTHVVSPLLFWVQIQSKPTQKELKQLNYKMTKYYSKQENFDEHELRRIDQRLLYAGKFSSDSQWYRVKILEYDCEEQKANVLYVDYGNTEILDLNRIRFLYSKFYSDDIYAVPVSLACAYPVDDEWKPEYIKDFVDLTKLRSVEVVCRRENDWPIMFCTLLVTISKEQQEDALNYLVERKIATIESPTTVIIPKFADHIARENKFYKLMQYKMQANNIPLNDSDFFTIDLVTENPPSQINSTDGIYFQPVSKKSIGSSVADSSGDHRSKEFNMMKIDVLPKKYIQLDNAGNFAFSIASISHPYDFYVYAKIDDAKAYMELEEKLNEFYQSREQELCRHARIVRYNFVSADSLCVVKSDKNQKFYRASVKYYFHQSVRDFSDNDKKVFVNYIDYGIMQQVLWKNIFPIYPKFIDLSPYCIPCQLDLIQPLNGTKQDSAWPDDAINYFENRLKSSTDFIAKIHKSSEPLTWVEVDYQQKLEVIFLSAFNGPNSEETVFKLNDDLVSSNFASYISDQTNGYGGDTFEIDHFDSASNKMANDGNITIPRNRDKWIPKEEANYSRKISEWVTDGNFDPDRKKNENGYSGEVTTNNECSKFVNEELVNGDVALAEGSSKLVEIENPTRIGNVDAKENPLDISVQKEKPEDIKKTPEVEDALTNGEVLQNKITDNSKNMPEIEMDQNQSIVNMPEMTQPNPKIKNKLINIDDCKVNKERTGTLFDELDPQFAAFNSITNFYGIDEENPEAHRFGFVTEVEGNICRQYLKFNRCYRQNCPFLHKVPETKKVSGKSNKKPLFESFIKLQFDPDEFIVFNSIVLEDDFTLTGCLSGFMDTISKTDLVLHELDYLIEKMNKYYGNKKFLPERTTLYNSGQIVAARNGKTKSWLRAKILEIHEKSDINLNTYTVKYVDFGHLELLSIREIYPINEEFLNFTFYSFNFQLNQFEIDKLKINQRKNDMFANMNQEMCAFLGATKIDDQNDFVLFGINKKNEMIDIRNSLIEN